VVVDGGGDRRGEGGGVMRLVELEPTFLKFDRERNDGSAQRVDSIAEADGIMFVCPQCLKDNRMERPGVHSVICWTPSVPAGIAPGPGRWNLNGTGLHDLTLTAGSSSILLPRSKNLDGTEYCGAHFFITNGEIQFT
jgi:hypothetical protein